MSDLGNTFSRRTQWDLTENHLSRTLAKLKMAGTGFSISPDPTNRMRFLVCQKEFKPRLRIRKCCNIAPIRVACPRLAKQYPPITAIGRPPYLRRLDCDRGTSEAYSFIFVCCAIPAMKYLSLRLAIPYLNF